MNHDAIVLLVRIIHAILGAAKQTPVFFEGLVRDPRSLIMLAVTFAAEAASLLILIQSRRRSMIPRRCLLCLAALRPAARSPYCCEAHPLTASIRIFYGPLAVSHHLKSDLSKRTPIERKTFLGRTPRQRTAAARGNLIFTAFAAASMAQHIPVTTPPPLLPLRGSRSRH